MLGSGGGCGGADIFLWLGGLFFGVWVLGDVVGYILV